MILRPLAVLAAAVALCCAAVSAASAQDGGPRLVFAPIGAPAGTPVSARATGLPPNARFALVWRSARPSWRVEGPKFYGIVAPESSQTLLVATSNAAGGLTAHFTVPEDFGYIHDVELHPEAGGALVAHQGFSVIPHMTMEPASGPPGTPITITFTGIGYRFYQAVWHLLYDGAQTGWLSGITTHGTARVTIRASGEPGYHTLQAIEGHAGPYLNFQQSPDYQAIIPTILATRFRIVAGPALAAAPVSAQRLQRAAAIDPPAPPGTPHLDTDYTSGAVGSPLTLHGSGFVASSAIAIEWETVVGNRLSASGWETQRNPLTSVTSDAGGAFVLQVKTPADLGGPHRIVAHAASGADAAAEATVAYSILPQLDAVLPAVVHPGAPVSIHLTGIGWSETGNTYTLDLDNGYMGYACGFNSQGDVAITIRAPGRIGRHYIDLYPTIYTGQILGPGAPADITSVGGGYFLQPMLNARDHPGERYPAYHLAFDVR
jgi:hypothetical protein